MAYPNVAMHQGFECWRGVSVMPNLDHLNANGIRVVPASFHTRDSPN